MLNASSFYTSPPGDRWREVRGFAPAGSVANSATSETFRDGGHFRASQSARSFPSTPACAQEFWKVDDEHRRMLVWASHSTFLRKFGRTLEFCLSECFVSPRTLSICLPPCFSLQPQSSSQLLQCVGCLLLLRQLLRVSGACFC